MVDLEKLLTLKYIIMYHATKPTDYIVEKKNRHCLIIKTTQARINSYKYIYIYTRTTVEVVYISLEYF